MMGYFEADFQSKTSDTAADVLADSEILCHMAEAALVLIPASTYSDCPSSDSKIAGFMFSGLQKNLPSSHGIL